MLSNSLGKPKCAGHQKGMLPRPEYYNGQCDIVAVNVHLGYSQEDSLVMNRASLERDMFRSEHVRSYKAENKIGQVNNLDDDGFPFIGANLQSGDVIIGKYAESGADHSVKMKHTKNSMVQKVFLSANDEGKNFMIVSPRQVRSPCLGDKFSSMHGQKGVLGYLESQENFPFIVQGIVPDIVINPHAFPSRKTPGQLLEAALGEGFQGLEALHSDDNFCFHGRSGGCSSNRSTMIEFDMDGVFEVDNDDWDEDENDNIDVPSIKELGECFLRNFCQKASTGFFEKYGVISHQINSYNDFIKYEIQRVFNSVGKIHVEPGYDPSKKGEGDWKHASVKFGKVTLERSKFWTGGKVFCGWWERVPGLVATHARLQNMTYSARIMVETHVKVYIKKLVRSDKFKTGVECFVDKECVMEDKRDVLIGRIPMMVNSELCWMSGVDKPDCEFDHRGYFIVKGAEKVRSSC
ncbi:DNA-directed RNA polymerase [Datura stramonium]|uniref:DNA-directed RNA polymerase n=1 Tax=Datura stramonium TaxID=4076 RepID=A0ABS8VD31_DATST|nr:DNA-directed RNA polymerase [Datura stramonium]